MRLPTRVGAGKTKTISLLVTLLTALFVAICYGIQIIWERDAGILTKLLIRVTRVIDNPRLLPVAQGEVLRTPELGDGR